MHGSRAHGFWHGPGWLFLLASVLIHLAVLWLLPAPVSSVLRPHEEILIALRDPPPPPEPELEPKPEEPTPRASSPVPAVLPNPEPPPVEPGPVIGVQGEGPEAISSGELQPPSPSPPSRPEPAHEPLPPPSEPDPEPEPEVDVQALLMEYASAVKASILTQKYYPAVAERLGHTGSVKVGFTLTADGRLAGVRIKSGSGWDELDEAALDAVRRAAPFDRLPPEAGRDQLGLSITLRYSLN